MFTQDHWRKPRETIATRLKDDDIGYATHGAHLAAEVICRLDSKPSELRSLDVLDYGCGTGRVARCIAPFFHRVVGYDPVAECIYVGQKECPNVVSPNVLLTHELDGVGRFHVIYSCNVLEHLDDVAANGMLLNLRSMARPGARLVLWYSMIKNARLISKFFGDHYLDLDQDYLTKNPKALIQVRVFNLP